MCVHSDGKTTPKNWFRARPVLSMNTLFPYIGMGAFVGESHHHLADFVSLYLGGGARAEGGEKNMKKRDFLLLFCFDQEKERSEG